VTTSKPCSDCPFVVSTPLSGSVEWLEDVFKATMPEGSMMHSCHKTDPRADGYVRGKARMCSGYIQMLENELNNTPGLHGVYNSPKHLIETYLRSVLGNQEFERIRKEQE